MPEDGVNMYYDLYIHIIARISISRHLFVYDDMATIVGNPFIKDIKNITCLFDPSGYFLKSTETSYRPVATLTYFINFFIC